MAGYGAPTATTRSDLDRSTRVVIVASTWHTEVMDGLIGGAQRALAEAGVTAELWRVPGSFELPLGAAQAFAAGADAVVALGVVIRGGTPHFDYVCAGASDGLMRVMLDAARPIGFGLLTCENDEQARARAGLAGSDEDKGYEAAQAALAMIR